MELEVNTEQIMKALANAEREGFKIVIVSTPHDQPRPAPRPPIIKEFVMQNSQREARSLAGMLSMLILGSHQGHSANRPMLLAPRRSAYSGINKGGRPTFTPGYRATREYRRRKRQLQRAARKRNRPSKPAFSRTSRRRILSRAEWSFVTPMSKIRRQLDAMHGV